MTNKLPVVLIAVGVAFGVALPSVPVAADDTGLAQALHDVRREGRKLCQSDHFHSGTSSGAPSKKAGMAQAIDSWQSFTALEYGTDWGSFHIAGSKSASCKVSSGSWSCDVEARPCKPLHKLRRVKRRAKNN